MSSGVGLLSNATSRFTVDVQPITAITDTFDIQALQLVPGLNGQRQMKFVFFDSAGRQFNFLVGLSDIMFEAYNIFGGTKTPHDMQTMGQVY